jgi:hypothetical protein
MTEPLILVLGVGAVFGFMIGVWTGVCICRK